MRSIVASLRLCGETRKIKFVRWNPGTFRVDRVFPRVHQALSMQRRFAALEAAFRMEPTAPVSIVYLFYPGVMQLDPQARVTGYVPNVTEHAEYDAQCLSWVDFANCLSE